VVDKRFFTCKRVNKTHAEGFSERRRETLRVAVVVFPFPPLPGKSEG